MLAIILYKNKKQKNHEICATLSQPCPKPLTSYLVTDMPRGVFNTYLLHVHMPKCPTRTVLLIVSMLP